MVLIAPPDAGEASAADLLARYDWIRYDRATAHRRHGGAVRARGDAGETQCDGVRQRDRHRRHGQRGAGRLRGAADGPDGLRPLSGARVRLGADAPTLQISLVSRKADEDSRVLQALTEAVERTLLPGVR